MSIDKAVAAVRDVDTLAVPLATGIPGAFLHALGGRKRFEDLSVFGALLNDLYEVFTLPGVTYRSGFFGPAERFLQDSGAAVEYVPADFRRFAPILRSINPRVMATAAAPPDADGWMSLSLHAGATGAEMSLCAADPDRVLIVEYSPNYPVTFGYPEHGSHRINAADADIVFESDRFPTVIEDPEPNAVDRAIATHALDFISSGCTLQTGIGSVPSTIARLLAEGDKGDFGIHSEMFTTGLMHLHQAGRVSNNKGVFDGHSISTFAAGSADLYEWLHENDSVRFLPVGLVNAPDLIAGNRQMVSINGALAIDLSGQVMADAVAGRQFSGVGGHEDFLAGPGLSLDDRSLLCLPSTVDVGGVVRSRIVARLPSGTPVSTPRHQIDTVITEHGAAELEGRTVRERAELLIAIADPMFRDELRADFAADHPKS